MLAELHDGTGAMTRADQSRGASPMSFIERLTGTLLVVEPDIRALIFIGVEHFYGPGFARQAREWVGAAEAAAARKQASADALYQESLNEH